MRELRELHSPYPGLRPFESHEPVGVLRPRGACQPAAGHPASRTFPGIDRAVWIGQIQLGAGGVVAGTLARLDRRRERLANRHAAPGERPLRRLAEALLRPDVLGRELGDPQCNDGATPDATQAALVEAELRRGPRALIELVADAQALADAQTALNLLILVDQFEELFRYTQTGDTQGDEAEAFVNLLLRPRLEDSAAAVRIHVALTMRIDALHQCARLLDLPEAINRAQYLVPRLKDDELRRAIAAPAQVFGGNVSPEVVDSLLNNVQGAEDPLPLLQHALSFMWDSAQQREPHRPEITLADMKQAGGLQQALSLHANRIFDSLTAEQQPLADILFRAITAPPEPGRLDARRPQRLNQIARFAGIPHQWQVFEPVLRAFSVEGANFLRFAEPLSAETVVDISHEALIRQWDRLRALAESEAALAAQYRRWRDRSEHHWRRGGELLAVQFDAAVAWRDGNVGLEPGVGQLGDGSSVLQQSPPHADWAARYALIEGEFETLLRYIAESEAAAEVKAEAKLQAEARSYTAQERRVLTIASSALAVVVLLLFVGAVVLWVDQLPRWARLAYSLATVACVVTTIFVVRTRLRLSPRLGLRPRLRTAIYGAGDAGVQLAQTMQLSPEYKAVCFLDDDPNLHHKTRSQG